MGQTVFIGGLIKQTLSQARSGVPILGRIPGLGLLFSSIETTSINTETVVVITPQVVGEVAGPWSTGPQSAVEEIDRRLRQDLAEIDKQLNETFFETVPVGGADGLVESN